MTTQTTSSADIDPPIGVTYDGKTGKSVALNMNLYSPGFSSAEAGSQWHHRYLGDLASIWQDYTGRGVSVAVYDTGVQSEHWDLAPNYDASKELIDDNGKRISGEPVFVSDDRADGAHGTACAGLIGAAHNGRGGVGVAYDVKLTGVNIFDDKSPAFNIPWAIQKGGQFDVISNSWGFGTVTAGTGTSRDVEGSYFWAMAKAVEHIADTGRHGLGTVFVKAAGNDGRNGIADSVNGDRHVVTVGAYRQVDGVASSYSNNGPYLLVSAPSNDYSVYGGTGLFTSDLLGWRGYNFSGNPSMAADYTDSFGGTSGATPIVAGVVSLMLDANAGLGWRDVRNILAASAKMPIAYDTGPVFITPANKGQSQTTSMNERQFELAGHAANWNGGAMHYSGDYGYGAVDAYSAVRMAEVWSLFGPAKVSGNEVHAAVSAEVGLTTTGTNAPVEIDWYDKQHDFINKPVSFQFNVTDAIDLEHVDLSVAFTNVTNWDGVDYKVDLSGVQIKLIAPDGTTSFTSLGEVGYLLSNAENHFQFGFANYHGVESKGTWTLEFSAFNENVYGFKVLNSLTIHSLKMDMYGSAPSNDDVYTYTNEFFKMAAIDGEGARRTLVDANGGTDWINAAAVSKDVVVSLVGGQTTTFGGKAAFTIDRTSVIENVVTGDGNDILIGNRGDNILVGMRGNDVLNGGMGNDILSGGTGSNRFVFDARSGHDTIVDWAKSDIIQTVKALKGVGSDGMLTVGANATLLLDGTANGNTVLLSDKSGAKLQAMGHKDGYYWYAYVADAAATAGKVVQEFASSPAAAAASMVDHIAASASGTMDDGAATFGAHDAVLTAHPTDTGFFLYDAMAGSMNGGVQLFA